MFLEQQISISALLKDHVTLKTGVMILNIQQFYAINKLRFKMYSNRKVILICYNIS